MSLAMYACPYDSPPPLLSTDFEKNNNQIKKTSRPKTQKNINSEKVNDVLLSINEETLSEFKGMDEEVDIEKIQKNEYKGVANYHKNIIPSYIETAKPNRQEPRDVLIDKVNYIIGLLENQRDEKTNNVVEDLIIYALLGCFIIFIIDKFVSVGKYVR
jgi:hypothetical protein